MSTISNRAHAFSTRMASTGALLAAATATRQDALEFASRTLKNLQFLERAREAGADVHLVTQLVNSLLGLIVFPLERTFVRFMLKQKIDALAEDGWPSWVFTLGGSDTLGDLVYHLRNAVAHGRITFSSDSRVPSEVVMEAADAQPGTRKVYWRARSIG